EDARDLAPHGGFGPRLAGAVQVRPEVAVARVFEREAVERAAASHQREPVVDPDGPRMPVQQQAEVGLAHPAVDVLADLDADHRRDDARAPDLSGEIDLAESPLAEQALDAVLEARLRAGDDLSRFQEVPRRLHGSADGPRARRGSGWLVRGPRSIGHRSQ